MITFFERAELLIREMIREEVLAIQSERRAPIVEGSVVELSGRTPPDRLLNASEVAEILGVTRSRVYELSRQHKVNGFPVIVLGERQYRYSGNQVYAWLRRSQRET